MKNAKLMAKSIDMDELNQVSGGNMDQCINDMMLFEEKVGLKLYRATSLSYGRNWPIPDKKSLARLEDAFRKYDVIININRTQGISNEYYINGEEVCRQEVWEHIQDIVSGKKKSWMQEFTETWA